MKLQPHSNPCNASSGQACTCEAGQINYQIRLQDRNEKLEKLSVASKALNDSFAGGDVNFNLMHDWRKAIADLEKPC